MSERIFAGASALVSGGAGGCGAEASRKLAAAGARVTIVDRQIDLGKALAADIVAQGGEAVFAAADVAKGAEIEQAVKVATDTFGAPTLLFNHAGTIVVKPFLDTSEADYDWLMDVNVRSMFLMTKAVLPGMLARGGGAIVNTSSISAVAATPMEVLYGTTKGAVHMFSRAIAVEFRDRNIRCNAVCPGFIRTPHGMREVEALERLGVDVSESTMAVQQGRMCEPGEVADAALFLLSDKARFINGTHLFVDNCFTAA
ncbi:NAD(P)-dependent dehydrogenase, short-chain alcohol dehydrogenase family [Arboricoccus pini]|uniref:NAD(P)-dependent dehydrogenase, short-chain alcohol dehydrogenase family n=1 Tax=Arboricoccus pini TaxID=1963835 RepID=A0A212RG39_9PROT|nr:SDR family oxidoreductase [Arboricoccus pini]SNB71292.1 NAD(P)-dependent dehydrogenase, short-chain alcohol dehydrogenase family [Arboricoccus pini]